MRKTRLISICVFSMFLFDLSVTSSEAGRVTFASEVGQLQSEKTIKGIIRDANGEPVIGASVIQSGTSNGVITSVDGTFSLNVSQGAKMDVSCLGYGDITFTVDKRDYFIMSLLWESLLSFLMRLSLSV